VMAAKALLISARSMARTLARVRETCLITFGVPVMKLTRETILEIEFLLAFRTE
jgi:hypothetical protein